MRAEGPDVTRSAAGRHAGELLLYLPTAALDQTILLRDVDANHASAELVVGSEKFQVAITVTATGALAELVLSRWGNPSGGPFAEHSFGATFQDEVTFGDITLPRKVTAGWDYRSGRWPAGPFIRYSIDHAQYS
jgi:hypothetical protein